MKRAEIAAKRAGKTPVEGLRNRIATAVNLIIPDSKGMRIGLLQKDLVDKILPEITDLNKYVAVASGEYFQGLVRRELEVVMVEDLGYIKRGTQPNNTVYWSKSPT